MIVRPLNRLRAGLARVGIRDVARLAAGILIPAVAVASGFTPLNHATDVLSVAQRPAFVALTPVVLLAVVAVVTAVVFPLRPVPRFARTLAIATGLLVAGGVVSIGASSAPAGTVVLLVSGVAAPLLFALALLCSDLPRSVMCWSFLLTTAAFLIRADIVFLLQEGWPTAETLLRVKFANAPYDFHYYTLNNPNYTGAFLVVPLTLAAFWAADAQLPNGRRIVLAALAGLMFVNLVLVYDRFTMVLGAAVLALALWTTPMPRRVRVSAGVLFLLACLAFVLRPTTLQYFGTLSDTSPRASQVVRIVSILDGLRALLAHPLTGVGLGRYGIAEGIDPSHSSIVQSGAETGIAGFVGALLLTGAILWTCWTVGSSARWRGLAPASAAAAAVFCVQTAIAAGPPTWLASYSNAIWGLSLGVVVAGTAVRDSTERHAVFLEEWLSRLRRISAARLRVVLEAPPGVLLGVYGLLAGVVALASWGGNDDASLSGPWIATLSQTFQALGISTQNPAALVHACCLGAMVVIVAVAPWCWWRLWGSWEAALVTTPVLLTFGFVFGASAIAAVPAVVTIGGLIVLLTSVRKPTGPPILLVITLAAVSGLASLVHPAAGFPVLLASVGAVLTSGRTGAIRAAAVVGVLVVHLGTGPLLVGAIGRDAQLPSRQAAIWQGAYYGLGWFENSRGIEAVDDPALTFRASVARVDDESAANMREDVLAAIRVDPTGSLWEVVRKAFVATADALASVSLLPLTLILLVILGIPRGSRRFASVAGPCAAGALMAPAVASPLPHYELGFVAAIGVVWLWMTGGVMTGLAAWSSRARPALPSEPALARRVRLPAAIAVGVGGILAVAIASPTFDRLRVNPRTVYGMGESPAAVSRPAGERAEASWSLRRGLPSDWTSVEGVRLATSPRGLQVKTVGGSGYQLLGPTRRVGRGSHDVTARATIERGGLYLAALDSDRNRFVTSANYSARQMAGRPLTLGFRMHLDRPTRVQIIVGNWNAREAPSVWNLEDLALTRSGATTESGALRHLINRAVEAQRSGRSQPPP